MCARGPEKSDHDFRRIWSRSSKAMEPDMAVELVANNKLLKLQNCYIGVIIGDDNASYVYAIQRASPFPVEKWSDISHIQRNLSNALYSLKLQDQVMKYISVNFATVLEQNRGEVEATAAALRNIVPHCFGDHTNCTNVGTEDWCRYHKDPLNYKHSVLPQGKPLSNPVLKTTLSNLMERYAKGAQKIAPGGSSQANESFNNMVCTKAPKYKYYGGSESFDFRVASAVLQKNEGTKYVQDTMKKLCLSPGAETATVREVKDDRRRKRAALQNKKRRSQNRKQKSTSVGATDKREGITYSTGCDVEGITRLLPNTTDLTGIHVEEGEMYYKGVPVPGVPARLALSQFLEFLSKLEADIILEAHNGMRYF
ncbi:hypothetical protein FOCC_FOCC006456 [Frankliniella occidentalis]|nr:hypothetical protein FOCC_FOCC006456 [Frankliniella occidentalis]